MGILKNFETWAHSESDQSSSHKRGFESWARPKRNDFTRPSRNPALDVDDEALYNPHSEYHNYNENIDDVIDDDDIDCDF